MYEFIRDASYVRPAPSIWCDLRLVWVYGVRPEPSFWCDLRLVLGVCVCGQRLASGVSECLSSSMGCMWYGLCLLRWGVDHGILILVFLGLLVVENVVQ